MPVQLSGSTSGSVTIVAPAVAGTNTLTLPAATGNVITSADSGTVTGAMIAASTITGAKIASATVAPSNLSQPLTAMTSLAPSGFSAADFTSIPSWVKRITVVFSGVSLSGTDDILVQAIVAGSPVTSGYNSTSSSTAGTSSSGGSTAGFNIRMQAAADTFSGNMFISNVTGNTWVSSHSGYRNSTTTSQGGGTIALAGTLAGVRVTVTTTNTYDAGTVNVLYE